MAKIDYIKVEQEIQKVQQVLQKRHLAEGKPIISSRAQEYYGVDNEPRPVPQEAVEKLLDEENEGDELASQDIKVLSESGIPDLIPPPSSDAEGSIIETPTSESLYACPKTKKALPLRPTQDIDFSLTSDKVSEKISPLYVLRQHIFWMKRQHIDKRYELIGTTKDEIGTLRSKDRLQDADLIRINELIKKATYVRSVWEKKKLGAASTEELIEIQKRRSKNKRFNVREKWLPL